MRVNTLYMRDRIISLCKINNEFANNDLKLIAEIWKQEGWDSSQDLYWNLRRVSRPETIRRTRQKLQEEGRIRPSEATIERRYNNFKKIYGSL